jgi:26S proteasome regulatory subunit N12
MTKLPALPPLYQPSANAQQQLILARKYCLKISITHTFDQPQILFISDCHLTAPLFNFYLFSLSAGDVLELAVLSSVRQNDDAAFDRNFAQLRPYYLDARSALPPSSQEALLSGLSLLILLVQNRIAEFHTTVELLPEEILATPEVAQVSQLEAWLMEGAYNKVLAARTSMASPYYIPLLDRLASTVRDEVASCSEASYESLPAAEAAKILKFTSEAELNGYASQRGWTVQGGRVVFGKVGSGATGASGVGGNGVESGSSAFEVIEHCVAYALQLERIV